MKSVMVLTTGTVLAQAIGYLVSPILTRIYSTEEMGELGIYMRAVGFIAAMATARFELTLPLPKYEGHSFLLYKLSLKISKIVILSMAFALGLYYVFNPISIYNLTFMSLTIASTFFLVFINLGTNWSIRSKNFKSISQQRIINSIVSNGLRWLFGIFSFGGIGLIIATMIGYMVSSVSFIREFVLLQREKFSGYSKKKNIVLVKEYREFPIINLPHVLVDLGRDLLIAGFVVYYFGKDEFGSYNHSYTMLRLPMIIIGASIGQVFFNKCSEIVNNGGSTLSLVKQTFFTLLALSIVPFTVIFFYGEPIFSFVFSESWADSGYYSEIMALWLMVNFLNSPLSSLPLVLRRQKEFFFIGLISSLIQLFCFGVLPLIYGTDRDAFILILWIVSTAMAIYLLFVFWITLYYAKKGHKERVS